MGYIRGAKGRFAGSTRGGNGGSHRRSGGGKGSVARAGGMTFTQANRRGNSWRVAGVPSHRVVVRDWFGTGMTPSTRAALARGIKAQSKTVPALGSRQVAIRTVYVGKGDAAKAYTVEYMKP